MFADLDARVIIISNENQTCALRHQFTACSGQGNIIWDYHVILLVFQKAWKVWDLDSQLGLGLDAHEYLLRTFPDEKSNDEKYAPRFRLVQSVEFVRSFSSDRSHMLDANKQWIAPPPAWPPIFQDGRYTFAYFTDMRARTSDTISLTELKQWLSQTSANECQIEHPQINES
jgi:hypothetical protein